MRIGFGVTVLAHGMRGGGVDGIGSYTHELLQRFATADELKLLPILYGRPLSPVNGLELQSRQFGRFGRRALCSALTGLRFSGARALEEEVDLVHATDHLIPKLGRIPVVATIMDAIPLSHPEWAASSFRSLKNILWRRSAQWASHVITISHYSKQEIETHFGLPGNRISVIPLGVDARWFRPLETETIQAVLQRYGLPKRFFLFVGTLQPRKNVGRVIAAHQAMPLAIRNEMPLVIVGRAGWHCDDVVSAMEAGTYGSSVRWLKYLPGDELLAVMKAAVALVFPSLCEGFGLPVLEAFAAGVPVVTSSSTSLPEVAGDAALLVDPLDVSSIAQAMSQLAERDDLAEGLRKRGYVRAQAHTWERTAAMTLDVYRQVVDGSRVPK